MVGHASESRNLLDDEDNTIQNDRDAESAYKGNRQYLPPILVLPLALLSALAMSSTSATAYFTYGTIICKDQTRCSGRELNRFARYIAIATAVSNVLGLIALGPLQRITKTKLKRGLTFWITVRSFSPIMLFFGKNLQNIYIALGSKIFDGLASDNILHFALNTAYAQYPRAEKVSSFISYSLALYMVGVATSPFVAGLFVNSSISFIAAITLFAVEAAYLRLFVHPKAIAGADLETLGSHEGQAGVESLSTRPEAVWEIIILPLRALARRYSTLFCGLSLLLYNVVQSYSFTALLVHTTVSFRFTGRENGFLISLVHSIGALYIFLSLYAIPKLSQMVVREHRESGFSKLRNSTLAILSIGIQASSMIGLGLASRPWQIYLGAALLALGLPTPSFIKAYGILDLGDSQRSEVLAALAVMETVGDVLGPVVLGGWQSHNIFSGGVFFLGSGLLLLSLSLIVCSLPSVQRGHVLARELQVWES